MKNLIVLLLLLTVACKTKPNPTVNYAVVADKNTTVFYFIRHAEKTNDGTTNPNLTTKGLARAKKYITYFKAIKFDAIYSTNFKRTMQTIAPIAKAQNIEPIIYNPFQIDYNAFKEKYKNKKVLIVGHSNTAPNFANKMLGKFHYNQMMEDNFANIYKVTIKDGMINHNLTKMIW